MRRLSYLDWEIYLRGMGRYPAWRGNFSRSIILRPSRSMVTRHDPAALQQAIGNLRHNAVRYTAAGGHLELVLEVAPEEIHILISDDGRGIPPDIQERIFDRFYRGPEQPEGDSGRGSGLGLAISREIVAIHQGRLSVSSQPGQGSTFTISLPRSEQ